MGKPVPLTYVQRTMEAAAKMRELEHQPFPELVVILLWAGQRAEAAGIAWECRLLGNVPGGTAKDARHLHKLLAGSLARLGKAGGRRSLAVTLEGKADGTTVQIQSSGEQSTPGGLVTIWLPAAKVAARRGEVEFDVCR